MLGCCICYVINHFIYFSTWLQLLFCCVLIFTLTELVFLVFWAAISRDSVSFFKFSFLSYVHVILCAISPVCHLKYPYSCLSSYFCFLIFIVLLFVIILLMLLLAAVISLSLLFLMLPSNYCVDASMQFTMLVSPLPPFFNT